MWPVWPMTQTTDVMSLGSEAASRMRRESSASRCNYATWWPDYDISRTTTPSTRRRRAAFICPFYWFLLLRPATTLDTRLRQQFLSLELTSLYVYANYTWTLYLGLYIHHICVCQKVGQVGLHGNTDDGLRGGSHWCHVTRVMWQCRRWMDTSRCEQRKHLSELKCYLCVLVPVVAVDRSNVWGRVTFQISSKCFHELITSIEGIVYVSATLGVDTRQMLCQF